jgi:membrane-associated phospholipid phosphatase
MSALLQLWLRHVSPKVATLSATIGTVGLLTCLTLLVGLGWLCQEVLEQERFRLDLTILTTIHHWANPTLDAVMLNLTRLGNPEFVVVIVVTSLGWLLWRQQRSTAQLLAIACLGALVLNQGLKLVFTRDRPLLWPRLITETSYSFPSGHALGSVVLYGFLAYLLAMRWPHYTGLIYAATAALVLAISLSRLYLGVHYPTDILAGCAIGFLWLMVCITMLKLQTQRL